MRIGLVRRHHLLPTLLITALVSGCGREHGRLDADRAVAGRDKAPVAVATVTLAPQDIQEFSEFPGTVQSRVTVEITSRLSAHILQIPAHSGSLVKEGDLLVTLDDRDAQARVKQVESALVSVQAVLLEKETEFKRYEQLAKSGTASQQQLEQARTLYETAKAAVAQAEEQIKEAKVNQGYTEIRSPMDGIVVDKHAQTGDLAAPGRSLLTLQKPTDLWLEASVSEGCVRRIHLEDPVTISVDSLDTIISSQVTEIVPAVDAKSRSFLVRAVLPANPALRPGMFGRLQFRCEKRKVIAAPLEAVVSRGQLDSVYVLEDGQANLRLIRLGRVFHDKVEVLSGLEAGDTLVVKPPPDLMDGDPVIASPAPAAASPKPTGAAGTQPLAREAKP